MAGEGSRFASQGYTTPKPLIDISGKPMIQRVVENLDFDAEYIFLVRKEHIEKYDLVTTLAKITNNRYKIVPVDCLTDGAASTTLLAKHLINTPEEILIANADQIMEYERENFIRLKSLTDVDSIVFTFNDVNPKWSFVKTDTSGYVSEVAEKNPISDIATCGVYWYRRGHEYVESAEQMIQKNIRVNNEFYIAPVFNELISSGKTLIPFYVHRMYGVGTPEDLEKYLYEIHLPPG